MHPSHLPPPLNVIRLLADHRFPNVLPLPGDLPHPGVSTLPDDLLLPGDSSAPGESPPLDDVPTGNSIDLLA